MRLSLMAMIGGIPLKPLPHSWDCERALEVGKWAENSNGWAQIMTSPTQILNDLLASETMELSLPISTSIISLAPRRLNCEKFNSFYFYRFVTDRMFS